jgi:hypothetical protein
LEDTDFQKPVVSFNFHFVRFLHIARRFANRIVDFDQTGVAKLLRQTAAQNQTADL